MRGCSPTPTSGSLPIPSTPPSRRSCSQRPARQLGSAMAGPLLRATLTNRLRHDSRNYSVDEPTRVRLPDTCDGAWPEVVGRGWPALQPRSGYAAGLVSLVDRCDHGVVSPRVRVSGFPGTNHHGLDGAVRTHSGTDEPHPSTNSSIGDEIEVGTSSISAA